MRKNVIIFTVIIVSVFLAANLPAKGIQVKAKSSDRLHLYKDYHALVVGVSNYEKWPRLPNATKDAKEVAEKLSKMGFSVNLLLDPTSQEMKKALSYVTYEIGIEKERAILIYYAGFGHTETLANGAHLGYIIPRDCPLMGNDPQGFVNRAISMKDLETLSLRIRSKHVLMLFDSCFSAGLFTLTRGIELSVISKKINFPVRQFITAGSANEAVPDKSIFTHFLLIGLDGHADLDKDGYITGTELGLYLSKKVANYSNGRQHPQYGKIMDPKLDKGDFVFALAPPKHISPPIDLAHLMRSKSADLIAKDTYPEAQKTIPHQKL